MARQLTQGLCGHKGLIGFANSGETPAPATLGPVWATLLAQVARGSLEPASVNPVGPQQSRRKATSEGQGVEESKAEGEPTANWGLGIESPGAGGFRPAAGEEGGKENRRVAEGSG